MIKMNQVFRLTLFCFCLILVDVYNAIDTEEQKSEELDAEPTSSSSSAPIVDRPRSAKALKKQKLLELAKKQRLARQQRKQQSSGKEEKKSDDEDED
jgi:hypothetical protein